MASGMVEMRSMKVDCAAASLMNALIATRLSPNSGPAPFTKSPGWSPCHPALLPVYTSLTPLSCIPY